MPNSKSLLRALTAPVLLSFLIGCASTSEPQEPQTSNLSGARLGAMAVADDSDIYVFGGSDTRGFLLNAERINPETREARILPGLTPPRRYASAVWDGDHSFYIIGGEGFRQGRFVLEPTIAVVDARNGRVSYTRMEQPRRSSSAALLNDRIYVVGGSVYEPSTDE